MNGIEEPTIAMGKRGNSAHFKEEPIGNDLLKQIHDAIVDARRLLTLPEAEEDPLTIVIRVHQYVGQIPETGLKINDDDIVDLGCIWGQQICAALNWHWATLIENGETEYEGIVSPDARFVIFPMHFVRRIVKGLEKDRYYDNTLLLKFNMLKDGESDEDVEPGSYLICW